MSKIKTKSGAQKIGAPKFASPLIRASALVFITGLTGLMASGCDPLTVMGTPDPDSLEVMYAGCHSVQEGPLCELKEASENENPGLTIHLRSENLARISFQTDTQVIEAFNEPTCIEELCTKTSSGFRFSLEIPDNASEILVEPANPSLQPWRLRLMSYRERPTAITQARSLKKTDGLQTAANYLEQNINSLPLEWKAEAFSDLARLYKKLGNSEKTLDNLTLSRRLHQSSGSLSMFIKDATMTVHTLIIDAGMRLNDAREMAAAMRGILPNHYESQHFIHWASLYAANKARDHRVALFHAEKGTGLAKVFNHKTNFGYFIDNYSHTLQKLNRMDEALALLEQHAAIIDFDSTTCKNAELLNTLGFVQWHRRQSLGMDGITDLPDALATIEKARSIAEKKCIDGQKIHEQTNTLINLALVHLDLGNTAKAENALDAIQDSVQLRKFHRQWMLQARGEIYLETGRYAEGLNAFKELENLSAQSVYPYLKPRSQNGQAHAYAMLGQPEKAHDLWNQVQQSIDAESLLVPIHEGRDLFLAQNQKSLALYVSSLIRNADAASALRVIRRARTQLLRSLQWQERLDSLNDIERSKWEIALGTYQRLRQDLETLKQNKWQVAQNERQSSNAKEKRLKESVTQAFDRALSTVGYSESESSEKTATLEARHIRLSFFKSTHEWLGFIENENTVNVTTIPKPVDWSSNENLANTFIAPFTNEIKQAKRIHIQPWGRLQMLDFHSLNLENRPLITYAPVVYPLGFTGGVQTNTDHSRALIVADPSGNLPKARKEAELVEKNLQAKFKNNLRTLKGVEATAESLRKELTEASIFHYAGHGQFNPTNNTNSSLILANESKFDVSDILALPRVPEHVILSACETAKSGANLPQEGLGIAQAFVTAGSQSVIASTRSVEDTLSQFMMTHLYQAHAATGDLALALQQSQKKAAAQFPDSDWATFRIMTRN